MSDCNCSSSMHYVTEFIGRKGRERYSGGMCRCGRIGFCGCCFSFPIFWYTAIIISYMGLYVSVKLSFNCMFCLLFSYM
jgi:hypothetical protein